MVENLKSVLFCKDINITGFVPVYSEHNYTHASKVIISSTYVVIVPRERRRNRFIKMTDLDVVSFLLDHNKTTPFIK